MEVIDEVSQRTTRLESSAYACFLCILPDCDNCWAVTRASVEEETVKHLQEDHTTNPDQMKKNNISFFDISFIV